MIVVRSSRTELIVGEVRHYTQLHFLAEAARGDSRLLTGAPYAVHNGSNNHGEEITSYT